VISDENPDPSLGSAASSIAARMRETGGYITADAATAAAFFGAWRPGSSSRSSSGGVEGSGGGDDGCAWRHDLVPTNYIDFKQLMERGDIEVYVEVRKEGS
jgi:hypothetical protein